MLLGNINMDTDNGTSKSIWILIKVACLLSNNAFEKGMNPFFPAFYMCLSGDVRLYKYEHW